MEQHAEPVHLVSLLHVLAGQGAPGQAEAAMRCGAGMQALAPPCKERCLPNRKQAVVEALQSTHLRVISSRSASAVAGQMVGITSHPCITEVWEQRNRQPCRTVSSGRAAPLSAAAARAQHANVTPRVA